MLLVTIAARMAAPARQAVVVVAIAANPLVLIHLVAGAHLDAVAAALLVSALALARSGGGTRVPRRWLAIVLCTLGAMVKLPVALGVAYLSLCALVAVAPDGSGPAPQPCGGRQRRRVRGAAVDRAQRRRLGLAAQLRHPRTPAHRDRASRHRHERHPRNGLAGRRSPRWFGAAHGYTPGGGRRRGCASGAPAADPGGGSAPGSWQPPTRDRLGLALLALGLLGPVLYGWYLAPALPLLALAAARPAAARDLSVGEISPAIALWTIVGLSVVLNFATIPSLGPIWSELGAHPTATAAGASATAAVLAAAVVILCKALARLRAAARLEQHARLTQPAPAIQSV